MNDVTVHEADVFRATIPFNEARCVYADPPYTKEDYFGYGVAPEWDRLIDRMHALGADDAVYILHIGSAGLHDLLPVIEARAPKRRRRHSGGRVRVLAWVKPWSAWRPNTMLQWAWEPILVWYGKNYRVPQRAGLGHSAADWIECAPQRSRFEHPTEKPWKVLNYLFNQTLHGAEGRTMVDLYAGTGSAALAACSYGLSAHAVERDPRWAQVIRDRRDEEIMTPRLAPIDALGTQGTLEGLNGGSPFQRRRDHASSGRRRAHLGRADAARAAENG